MNLTYQPADIWAALGSHALLVGGIVAVIITAFLLQRWINRRTGAFKNSPFDGAIASIISGLVIAVVGLFGWIMFAMPGLQWAEADSAEESLIQEVEETYGITLSPKSVDALLTYPNPTGSTAAPTLKLHPKELADGYGSNEVFRYGTTELFIQGEPVDIQFTWADGWRLFNTETKQELSHNKADNRP